MCELLGRALADCTAAEAACTRTEAVNRVAAPKDGGYRNELCARMHTLVVVATVWPGKAQEPAQDGRVANGVLLPAGQ